MAQSFLPSDLAAHHSTARDRNTDLQYHGGDVDTFHMHLHLIVEPTPCALRDTWNTVTSWLDYSAVVPHITTDCTTLCAISPGPWPSHQPPFSRRHPMLNQNASLPIHVCIKSAYPNTHSVHDRQWLGFASTNHPHRWLCVHYAAQAFLDFSHLVFHAAA